MLNFARIMNSLALSQDPPRTEKEFISFLDRCNDEMRQLIARMEAGDERSRQARATIQATLDRVEENLRHVQTTR